MVVAPPTSVESQVETLCINSIRFLAVDAINKSNSGHPGLPMGCAPMAFALWDKVLQHVPDGNTDVAAITKAIEAAKAVTDRPSLIKVTTTIGYGSPNKANTAGVHGAALGADEAELTRKQLEWSYGSFEVPEAAYEHWRQAVTRGAAAEAQWNQTLEAYRSQYPTEAAAFERQLRGELPQGWDANLPSYGPEAKGLATRQHSFNCLNAIGPNLPELIGGSADLTHSNLTDIKGEASFQKGGEANRYLHFGVREHAMAAILNGLAYHGSGLVPYGGTFLVFAGYMIGAMRLSALSELGVIYVLTHDSIGLGEDGPTHQPVETLANLRAIPNLLVIRPGDGNETSGAYQVAVANRKRPTVLALSRQAMANQATSSAAAVARGGYILEDSDGTPDLILIGSGTELELCTKAAAQLRGEGRNVRVVSMPCVELFEEQDPGYRETVLPAQVRKRLVVEASSSFGWHKYTGFEGDTVSIDRFGASAPGPLCLEKFGFTVENVVAKARALG
jgi:transketolase